MHTLLPATENDPAGHCEHVVEPTTALEMVPARHGAHAVALVSGDAVPGGHGSQDVPPPWRPSTVVYGGYEYVPTPHTAHWPLDRRKLPPEQAVHCWKPLLSAPRGQGVHADAPGAGAMLVGGHSAHAVAPYPALNAPTAQGAHEKVLAPGTIVLYVPGAHNVHCDAPVDSATLPAGHGTHAVAPAPALYEPTAHGTQEAAEETKYVPGEQSVHWGEPATTATDPTSHCTHDVAP